MSRRIFQDDRMPWSLFLPMTMAVVVGVLIADGVRYAIGEVFAARAVTDAARMPSPAAAPAAAMIVTPSAADATEPASSPASVPGDGARATLPVPSPNPDAAAAGASAAASSALSPPSAAAADGTTPAPSADPAVVASPTIATADQVERLPGPTSARRDKQSRACINGTVAVRDSNGWQQELSSDRPVRCEQTGP